RAECEAAPEGSPAGLTPANRQSTRREGTGGAAVLQHGAHAQPASVNDAQGKNIGPPLCGPGAGRPAEANGHEAVETVPETFQGLRRLHREAYPSGVPGVNEIRPPRLRAVVPFSPDYPADRRADLAERP